MNNVGQLSPGGWTDCTDVDSRRWIVLAGTPSAIPYVSVADCPEVHISLTD